MTRTAWICVGLLALSCAAMHYVCWCDFVNIDDGQYVTDNHDVLGGLTSANVHWAFTDSCSHSGFFIPLIWLSLQLDATLFGPEGAWGYHADNLLLHVASVLLFYLVLQRMTGDIWRSAAVAALFAIHPLRVESVAWVTERKDVLSMLFLVLTITAYVWYTENPGWRRYSILLLVFVLGLTSKVTLITLPFALLLLDYWPLYRWRYGQEIPDKQIRKPAVPLRRLVIEKLPLLAAAVAMAVVDLRLIREIGAVAPAPLYYRIGAAFSSYLTCLEKTFWPTRLAPLYPGYTPIFWYAALGAVVLATVTAIAYGNRRRRPYLAVGWLWFVGTMIPLSGIVTIGPQSTADRFSYIPHLGLFMALVWGISSLPIWERLWLSVRWAGAVAVLAMLGVLTWMQTLHWKDAATISLHTLNVTENNYLMHFCLASDAMERNDLDTAETHFQIALTMQPDKVNIRNMYVYFLLATKQPAEAIRFSLHTISLDPTNSEAHHLIGRAYFSNRVYDLERAKKHFEIALNGWRDKTKLPIKGRTLEKLGMINLHYNVTDEAIKNFNQALENLPNLASAHRFLGIAFARVGRWDQAEQALRRAITLDPNDFLAYSYLAYTHARAGKEAEAHRQYKKLVTDIPNSVAYLQHSAMEVITQRKLRDLPMARELAIQACEASDHQDALSLDALAASYAADGDFSKAAELATKAKALTRDPNLEMRFEAHIQLFQQGKELPIEDEMMAVDGQ